MHELELTGPFTLLNLTPSSSAVARLLAPCANCRCELPITKITNFKIITLFVQIFYFISKVINLKHAKAEDHLFPLLKCS